MCGGAGWLSPGPTLGAGPAKLIPCPCGLSQQQRAPAALARLGDELASLSACTFEAFDAGRPLAPLYVYGNLFLRAEQVEKLSPSEQLKAKEFTVDRQRYQLDVALTACRAYAAIGAGWLCLHGAYGAGKSHLAAAIALDWASRGRQVRYRSTPGLLDALKAGFADGTSDATFHDVLTCDLLVLDDLGAEHLSGWARERLFRLLNERQHRATIITSNVHPDDLAGSTDVDAGRLMSRIVGNSRCVWLPISDYRRLRGQP